MMATLLSPTSMDALLRVDLTSLRTDAVLVYAERVAHLQPSRSITQEQLQMLFVLSQKLVRWLLDERCGLERLRHALEEELLKELGSETLAQPTPIKQEAAVGNPSDPPTTIHASVKTDLSTTANTDGDVQTEEVESVDQQTECDDLEETSTPSANSLTVVNQADSEVQTEVLEETIQSVAVATQTDLRVPCVDWGVHETAEMCDVSAQTFSQLMDTSMQELDENECSPGSTVASVGCVVQRTVELCDEFAQTSSQLVDSSVQTLNDFQSSASKPTQMDPDTLPDNGKMSTDVNVQVEIRHQVLEQSVQVGQTPEHVEAKAQTELAVSCTATQTRSQSYVEAETQVVTERSDQSISTQDDLRYADLGAQTTELEVTLTPEKLPLEVYFQVHWSVVRLQRIVRGFVTRRRFFKMLNDLVNAK